MGKSALVRSHVERCLQDVWDLCRVRTDPDGDYPFSNGTAMCFVRIEPGDPTIVRVFGYAVIGIDRSGKLLKELNDIDARCRTASVRWQNGAVVVSQVLHIDGVSHNTLRQACNAVGSIADDIGEMIAAVFGGETPIDAAEAQAHGHREAS
jgi:Putative bacterial sensory transduction regulator